MVKPLAKSFVREEVGVSRDDAVRCFRKRRGDDGCVVRIADRDVDVCCRESRCEESEHMLDVLLTESGESLMRCRGLWAQCGVLYG